MATLKDILAVSNKVKHVTYDPASPLPDTYTREISSVCTRPHEWGFSLQHFLIFNGNNWNVY